MAQAYTPAADAVNNTSIMLLVDADNFRTWEMDVYQAIAEDVAQHLSQQMGRRVQIKIRPSATEAEKARKRTRKL